MSLKFVSQVMQPKKPTPYQEHGAFCVLITAFALVLYGGTVRVMGGFFERFTKPNVDTQKVIDAEKARIQGEGAAVSARTAEEFAGRRAAMGREHAARMAPIDKEIADLSQGMEDNRKSAHINSVFNRFEMGVAGRLQMGLMRQNLADPHAAWNTLKSDFDARLNTIKANPKEEQIAALQSWVIEKTDERHVGAVEQEFKGLRERLGRDRMSAE